MVERLFLKVPRGCLWFAIVVFPDPTHYFFTSVSFIVIDRLFDKNGKNSISYIIFRRVLEESKIQRTLVICFCVWCKTVKVRLDSTRFKSISEKHISL